MTLTWKDTQDIAIELADTYPDTDPLTLGFEKMHALLPLSFSFFTIRPAT